jgi:hypothetical protein
MWLTYLQVGAEASVLDYDLAVSADPTTPPTITDTGVELSEALPVLPKARALPLWPIAAGGLVGLIVAATYLGHEDRRNGAVPT